MKKKTPFQQKAASSEPTRTVKIGPGIWMVLPASIEPEARQKRVENYLQKANKQLPVFNPNA